MNECIRKQPPDLAGRPDCGTIELQPKQNRSGSERDQKRGQNRSRHVYADEHRGHIDRIPTHPRYRPIIIGRGHPEHVFN
jgi:ribosomal protein S18 acetylase RimI-like enzyme